MAERGGGGPTGASEPTGPAGSSTGPSVAGSGNVTAVGTNIALGPGARVTVERKLISFSLHRAGDRSTLVAQKLAKAVRQRWSDEVRQRGLDRPDPPMPVAWKAVADGLVESWSRITEAASASRWEQWRAPRESWAPDPSALMGSDGLGRVLLDKVPTRRLVVLGGPGAGKTSLLAEMSLYILDRRETDRRLPIPVVLSLATWDPGSQPDPWRWMADRIAAEYVRLSPEDVEELHGNHSILPVLDSLDEVPEQVRTKAVALINEVLSPGLYLVMSSRADEYERVVRSVCGPPALVSVAAGVELTPLSAREVAAYLDRDDGGPHRRWKSVLTGAPAHLLQALSRPLTIDLARTLYNRRAHEGGEAPPDPAELLAPERFPDRESVEEHLFDSYLPAAYSATFRPPQQSRNPRRSGSWRADRAQRWLTFVARSGTPAPGGGAASFEWWRLRDTLPTGLVGLVLGAVPAAAVGLVAAVDPRLGSGLGMGLLVALASGMLLRFVGVRRGPGAVPRLSVVRWRLPAQPSTGIAAGLAGGFAGGVLGGLLGGYLGVLLGVQNSLTVGIMGGCGVGVGTGAMFGPWRGMLGSLCGGAALGLCAGFWPGTAAGVLDGVGALFSAGLAIELKGVRQPAEGLSAVRVRPMTVVAVVTGSSIGLMVARATTPLVGAVTGLAVGVLGGYAAGVEGNPTDLSSAVGPPAVLARDRRTFLVVGLLGGGSFGVGAAAGVVPQVGLAGGLTVGVVAASIRSCWGAYLVARVWHAARGNLPWRLMAFLRDAHTHRNVLRQVGAAYQFRHVELETHLVADERRPVPQTGPPATWK